MDMIQVWNLMCTFIVVTVALFITILLIIVVLLMTRKEEDIFDDYHKIVITYMFLGNKELEQDSFIRKVYVEDSKLHDYDKINKAITDDIYNQTLLEEVSDDSFVIIYKDRING